MSVRLPLAPVPSLTDVSATVIHGAEPANAMSFVRVRKLSKVAEPFRVSTPNAPSTTAALKLVLVTSTPSIETLTVEPCRTSDTV